MLSTRVQTARSANGVPTSAAAGAGQIGQKIHMNTIVILGASGDLAKRKLIPALHALYREGTLDDSFIIVGTGRTFFTDNDFRARFEIPGNFAARLSYHQGIAGLKRFVLDKGTADRIVFFLAQPPSAYAATA
jgi:glucose-6-phosphate 1-dehydrogenase